MPTPEEKAALEAAKAEEAARVAAARAEAAAAGQDPDERVYIKHSGVDAPGGPVPRYTIPLVWAGKGWSETDPPVAE